MSTIKSNSVQIGQSNTGTENFTLAVPAIPDGSIKLARGSQGATTQDIVAIDAYGNVNIPGTLTVGNGAGFSFRNKIINGNMLIDQRSVGASITPAATTLTVDRFIFYSNVASKLSFQQVADAPTGFKNSLKITTSSQYTPATGDVLVIGQNVEGYNIIDLAWGTSSAKAITVSFWVKTSVAGTYNFIVQNNSENFNYVSTFVISSVNTWTKITKTIPGPTTGAWATDSNRGLLFAISLGGGASNAITSTPDTWETMSVNTKFMTSGSVHLVSQINGSTFQFTGVQLEEGSVATPFEVRPLQVELALCQRYFEKSYNDNVALGAPTTWGQGDLGGVSLNALDMYTSYTQTPFKVVKRVEPTITFYNPSNGQVGTIYDWTIATTVGSAGARLSKNGLTFYNAANNWTANHAVSVHWAASAEL